MITRWGLCEEQLQPDSRVSSGLLVPLWQTELSDRDSSLYHREPRIYWRCPRRSLRTYIASRRLKTIAELSQDQPVVHTAQRGRCLKTLVSSKALSEGFWALLGKPCGSKSNEVGQSRDGEVWDSEMPGTTWVSKTMASFLSSPHKGISCAISPAPKITKEQSLPGDLGWSTHKIRDIILPAVTYTVCRIQAEAQILQSTWEEKVHDQ